jgi:Tol biopolymer transport system component
MKTMNWVFALLTFTLSCSPKEQPQKIEKAKKLLPSGDYFGLNADTTAQVFAEDIVSREFQELNAVFSPDGKEFYFTIADPGRNFYTIVFYKRNEAGEWEGPEVAPFSGSYSDADPFFSPDGKKLYFISQRPLDNTVDEPKDFDIWMVEKTDEGWGSARNLGAPINTDKNEYYVSVTKDGSIFYSGEYKGGKGYSDIYEAKLVEGKYVVENLGEAINSPTGEGDPYISPDGNMLIFMSWGRPDDLGRGDLYISFKENGVWRKAVNLGEKINSTSFEYCPMISPDGNYFFWTSYRSSPLHSKEPRTYEAYLQRLNNYDNGLGNVYWIKAEVLESYR